MSCGRYIPVTRGLVVPCDRPEGGDTTPVNPPGVLTRSTRFTVRVDNDEPAGPVLVVPDPPGSSFPPSLGGPEPDPGSCLDFLETEEGNIVVDDALEPIDLGCPPTVCLELLEITVGDPVLENDTNEGIEIECL